MTLDILRGGEKYLTVSSYLSTFDKAGRRYFLAIFDPVIRTAQWGTRHIQLKMA